MKVLLSIKPEFAHKIFNGEKKFEYRKSIFKQKVDTVVVYSTMPEGRIIGEFKIDGIIETNPDLLWNETKEFSGITYDFFSTYFNKRENAYAIKVGELTKYKKPINPKEKYENFTAPQSFCYIT